MVGRVSTISSRGSRDEEDDVVVFLAREEFKAGRDDEDVPVDRGERCNESFSRLLRRVPSLTVLIAEIESKIFCDVALSRFKATKSSSI